MNNFIREFLHGRHAKINFLLILTVISVIGLGCFGGGRSKDAKPIPAAFLGEWNGQDGSKVVLRGDNTGDYISGSTKIEGGTAEVNEADKTVSITFFGLGKTLKIDSPPSGDTMKLEGVTYKRKGGSPVADTTPANNSNKKEETSNSNKKSEESSGDTPSESEVNSLVKDTMSDFANAIDQEDFSDFHSNTSKDFQVSYTPDQLKNSFSSFIAQKDKVLPSLNDVSNSTANFSSPPRVRTEKGYKILVAEGDFPSSPYPVKFETEYEMEKGSWKLLKIKVRL